MEQRTYNQAVDVAVNFWIEKSFKTLFNQNNGDDSDTGKLNHLLMNSLAAKSQNEVSEDQINKFKSKLSELLLSIDTENAGHYATMLEVDYRPNEMLSVACKYAGVSEHCLPIKTFTRINKENKVEGRYQYGGDWFSL